MFGNDVEGKFLFSKWLNINYHLAYKTIINCINVGNLKYRKIPVQNLMLSGRINLITYNYKSRKRGSKTIAIRKGIV
jgi:hypothetical protein